MLCCFASVSPHKFSEMRCPFARAQGATVAELNCIFVGSCQLGHAKSCHVIMPFASIFPAVSTAATVAPVLQQGFAAGGVSVKDLVSDGSIRHVYCILMISYDFIYEYSRLLRYCLCLNTGASQIEDLSR